LIWWELPLFQLRTRIHNGLLDFQRQVRTLRLRNIVTGVLQGQTEALEFRPRDYTLRLRMSSIGSVLYPTFYTFLHFAIPRRFALVAIPPFSHAIVCRSAVARNSQLNQVLSRLLVIEPLPYV
jgi:hypothetical protein